MFNFFKPQANQHYRNVQVISSRKPTEVIRCYSDEPICSIDALRAVDKQIAAPELGEVRQIKAFLD